MRPAPRQTSRPLLKWAGGKRQLLDTLSAHYPADFTRYVEPFFGSGAVFFDLQSRGVLDGRRAWVADVNADLVGCYRTVRDQTEAVIAALARLQSAHRTGGAAFYYDIRDQQFNPMRAALSREPAAAAAHGYTPALAAMLIFLNRTGFNGLFRLNRAGGFNVPAGRYVEPRICDPDHVRAVAAAFASERVTLDCKPFDEVLAGTGAGDFVYCDPPYAPVSRTASFAQYTASGFTSFDQRRLLQAVIGASRRGAHVLLSNSSAPEIVELYGTAAARKAGLQLTLVPARRAINSRASGRGPVHEVVVTNVRATPPLALPTRLKMAKAGARVSRARTA